METPKKEEMAEHDGVRHKARRGRWVFLGFAAVAGFFLVSEHRAHVLGLLPWLLLAACPLMHVFMHGGHGHGGSARQNGAGPGEDRS